MRLSDLISDPKRDLKLTADLGVGMIVRQKNQDLDTEVIGFNLSSMMSAQKSQLDPELMEFDEVLIFSVADGSLQASSDVPQSVDEFDLPINEGVDSRRRLLQPVIDKLRRQARQYEPVQLVSISGAVRAPGTYPLTQGATINSLISAAGGLKDSAFLESLEVRRLKTDMSGKIFAEYLSIGLIDGADGTRLLLESRDHITVREIPDWSPEAAIKIEGEVLFPGEYRIRKGETLSQVIERAGGLTPQAAPASAIFMRESIRALEKDRVSEFVKQIQTTFASRLLTEETTNQNISEIKEILDALEGADVSGRLLIDLSGALSGDQQADLEVVAGDSIVIPRESNTVSVVGEVNRVQTHMYREELGLEDYVELSAGATRRADVRGIYIVKANGAIVIPEQSLWRFNRSDQWLDRGDTIVVPINTQYKDSLASWRDITSIVYQSVVSLAAVASL